MSDRNEVTLNTGMLPAEDEIYAQVDQGNTQTGPVTVSTTVTGGTSVLNRATQLATVGGVLSVATANAIDGRVFVVTYGNIVPPGTYVTGASSSTAPATAATIFYAINIYTGEKYPLFTGAQINAYAGGTTYSLPYILQNDYVWIGNTSAGNIWGFNTRQASGRYVDTTVAQLSYTNASLKTLTGFTLVNINYVFSAVTPSPSGLCIPISSTSSPYATKIVNLTTGAVVAGPITNTAATPYQSESMITLYNSNMALVNATFNLENARVDFVNLLTGAAKTVGPTANTKYQPMAIIDDTSFYCVVTNTSALTSTLYTFLDDGSTLVGSPIATVPYMGTTSLQTFYKICADGALVMNDYAATAVTAGPTYYTNIAGAYIFSVPQPSLGLSIYPTMMSFVNTGKLIATNMTIGSPALVTFYELF